MSGRSSPEDEASTDPIVCAKKVAAFIRYSLILNRFSLFY